MISYTGATIGRDNATVIDITGNVLEKGSEVKILGGTDHLTITGSDTEYAAKAYDGLIQIGIEATGKTTISQGGVSELGGQIEVKGKDITLTGNDVQLGEYSSAVYKTKQKLAAYAQGGTINIGTENTAKALLTGNVMTLGGTINVLGNDLTVNGDSSDYAAYEQGGTIQIGNEKTNRAEVNGGVQGNGSIINVLGENVTLTQGAQDNAAHSIVSNITVGIDGKTKADITGTLHAEGGDVNVLGKELTLKPGKTEDLAYAEKGGKVTIGSTSSTKTVMEGKLSTDEKSQVEAWLNTSASLYTGALDDKQILNEQAGVTLHLNDGGTWKEEGHSKISNILGKGGVIDLANGKLTDSVTANVFEGDDGIVKMDIDATNNKPDDLLTAGTHTGITAIDLTPVDAVTNDAQGKVLAISGKENGYYTGSKDVEGKLFWDKWELARRAYESGDEATFAGVLKEAGLTAQDVEAYWYLKNAGHYDPKSRPTTSVQGAYGAASLVYNTWRTDNDKLLKRMGELRQGGIGETGLWARTNGNKIERNGKFGFKNKYETYELGYDAIVKNTDTVKRFVGGAFRYLDGNSSFARGSGENNAYGGAFYVTDERATGHYLDFIVRYDKFDTDYDVWDTYGQKIHGDVDADAYSLSAEYGRKNDLNKGWYIEPQTQLTLGYLKLKDYTTSNGIAVGNSHVRSAVWRGGFNLGKEFNTGKGRKGIVYAKANLYHEFGGSLALNMAADNEHVRLDDGMNDTWFEYGIGAALQLAPKSQLYFDFEKSTGSDYKKDWTWNAGLRFEF